MKPYTKECIRQWRINNPERVREQGRIYAKRHYEKKKEWLMVTREFRNILISDYFKETRGRKRLTHEEKEEIEEYNLSF